MILFDLTPVCMLHLVFLLCDIDVIILCFAKAYIGMICFFFVHNRRIYMMGQAVNFEDVDMDLTRRMYMKDPATIYLNVFPWQFPIVRGRGLNKWYSPLI